MLFEILLKVALTQVQQTDRLTLAIPTNQILTYYETKILTYVALVNSGMIFTLAVPFASGLSSQLISSNCSNAKRKMVTPLNMNWNQIVLQ